jgi:hypothetical protein
MTFLWAENIGCIAFYDNPDVEGDSDVCSYLEDRTFFKYNLTELEKITGTKRCTWQEQDPFIRDPLTGNYTGLEVDLSEAQWKKLMSVHAEGRDEGDGVRLVPYDPCPLANCDGITKPNRVILFHLALT